MSLQCTEFSFDRPTKIWAKRSCKFGNKTKNFFLDACLCKRDGDYVAFTNASDEQNCKSPMSSIIFEADEKNSPAAEHLNLSKLIERVIEFVA